MRTRIKIFIAVVVLALLVSGFLFLKPLIIKSSPGLSENKLPYPGLADQRRVLAHKSFITPYRVLDSNQIVDDLKYLSSDECEGRCSGTKGHTLALQRILDRMRELGLDSLNNSLEQKFTNAKKIHGSQEGNNVIGYIKGNKYPDRFIVISAHYDHLGRSDDGKIFYGASDNASGTACILGVAKYFKKNPSPYSLIIAAFDREESWMEGSKYFVNNSPVKLDQIKFNLNVDMIARNDSNEIFVCGIKQHPEFKYLINKTQKKTNVKLLMGHDTDDEGRRNNWVYLSDHAPFNEKGIPFLYIGVEDHKDYHQPSDTWDKIDLNSYIENCNMIVGMIKEIKF